MATSAPKIMMQMPITRELPIVHLWVTSVSEDDVRRNRVT
jgi:hypothetical protein